MRVAILADPIDNQKAGIHYYTKELVKNLGLIDTNIEYIAITENKHPSSENVKMIQVKNHKIPGYKALRMFFIIPWLLRRLNVDIVVEPAHFGPFNLPKRIKRVTVIHDLTPILFPQYHLFHSQILQRIFLKSILHRATHIITNSEYTKKDIVRVFPFTNGKVSHIYLGKDEIFKPVDDATNIIEKYAVSEPYFLFVGTIEPRKNIETLLNAFADLKENGNDKLSLVVIGQMGWKSKSIKKSIEDHPYRDNIIIPGYIERNDLPAFYSMAIACVQPSYYEGFGMPVVESLSCGTPSIVSDVSSLPEVGGDAVLIFNPNKYHELITQMNLVLNNPRTLRDLEELSVERAKKFNWKTTATRFDILLSSI